MRKNYFVTLISFLAICLMMAGCKSSGVNTVPMVGILDMPLQEDSIPANVKNAMDNAIKFHSHEIMSDTIANIAVFAIDEIDQTPSEGYGIMVTKGAETTNFLNIRNTRQPQAKYDAKTGDLWLTSSAMEGTGVHVEWLYQIRFQENGKAYIKIVVNPYNMQQELLKRMGYTIDGERVTLDDQDYVYKTCSTNNSDQG